MAIARKSMAANAAMFGGYTQIASSSFLMEVLGTRNAMTRFAAPNTVH